MLNPDTKFCIKSNTLKKSRNRSIIKKIIITSKSIIVNLINFQAIIIPIINKRKINHNGNIFPNNVIAIKHIIIINTISSLCFL
jgi:hypothetical protein